MGASLVAAALLIAHSTAAAAASWPAPDRLRVEGLQEQWPQPVVLSEPLPRFSFSHGRLAPGTAPRGLAQSAYRITVRLQPQQRVVWDSGAVATANTTDIQYAGSAPLQPFEAYTWTVAWLASDGRWSANATASCAWNRGKCTPRAESKANKLDMSRRKNCGA